MPSPKKDPAAKTTGKRRPKRDRTKRTPAEAPDQADARTAAQNALDASTADRKPFPVVGIGASAGGLEALEAFFQALPTGSGMAFVVITHTDPSHTSLLPDIIERRAHDTVRLIEDGLPVQPNTIYMPPSDHNAVIEGDIFRLRKRPARDEVPMPVDLFLKHLARTHREQAACVILSGTGTDGTHGLRAVKEQSGLAMAQTPESARHGGMPASAIATGLVDVVAPPTGMPERLITYFEHPAGGRPLPDAPPAEAIDRILALMASRTRHDFSLYKANTLKRRIARRIAVTRARDAADYLKVLQRDSREIQALFQDLLIGVTSFFRDPEAFAYLKAEVLPKLFSNQAHRTILRAWLPGCATGEEAYSAAILLKEYMEENDCPRELQIFGTDIDPRAIEKARAGQYLKNIITDVDGDRLERFFALDDKGYLIQRAIREPVIFAEQNVLRDPPFSDLDLLICRNLLIYLKTEAQDRLIPLFHHVLRPNGILFLGNSETIGRFPGLFEPLSKSFSIFRKRETPVSTPVHFPSGKVDSAATEHPGGQGGVTAKQTGVSLEKAVETLLMQSFVPACVVVGPAGEVLFTRGRTGRYLELAPGRPNLNIADMAREGLRFPLITAMRKAREGEDWVRENDLWVKTNGAYQSVDLMVKRFHQPSLQDALIVVIAETRPSGGPERAAEKRPDKPDDGAEGDQLEALEDELLRLRMEYRGTREELVTSNEELRSANEEMQSSNEELQSTNEELESSREELHSLNEELSTVNDELNRKIEELQDGFQAISHTLDSTRIAIVFLDRKLAVVRFTTAATGLINLIETDVGRPLAHIVDNLVDTDLADLAAGVLETLTPREAEVQAKDGHWYRMSIMVHRKNDRLIEGIVITFMDIDAQKEAQAAVLAAKEREVAAARRFSDSIVATVREALLVLDDRMRVLTANDRFYSGFQVTPAETEGTSLFELGNGQWDIPELRQLLSEVARKHKIFKDYKVALRLPKIGKRQMLLNARHLQEADPAGNKILLAIVDEPPPSPSPTKAKRHG